jgi:hypothetical protein
MSSVDLSESPTLAATAATNVSKGADRAYWSLDDEAALIKFLTQRKAEAGDGGNFPKKIWNAAAVEMAKQPNFRGGPKTPSSCSSKWNRVRIMFIIYIIFTQIVIYDSSRRPIILLTV